MSANRKTRVNHKGKEIHRAHAAARELGFVRKDRRGMSKYPATFERITEHETFWLNKNVAGDWQAHLCRTSWYTPWFDTPAAAWVYGCVHNWGES